MGATVTVAAALDGARSIALAGAQCLVRKRLCWAWHGGWLPLPGQPGAGWRAGRGKGALGPGTSGTGRVVQGRCQERVWEVYGGWRSCSLR